MSDKNTYCVYLLECCDGTYYCGITTDMELRLAQHNAGTASKYTRGRTPVTVHARTPNCFSKSMALKLECTIKKCPRHRKAGMLAAAQPADGPD